MQEHPTPLINGEIQSRSEEKDVDQGAKQGLFYFKTEKKMEWIKSRGDLFICHICMHVASFRAFVRGFIGSFRDPIQQCFLYILNLRVQRNIE